MKKGRKTLLEQLYDGEFYPSENIIPGNPGYAAMSQKAGDEIEYILSRLNDEEKVRFDKLIDLMGEMEHMGEVTSFAYGLRTGILLIFELFSGEDWQPIIKRRSSQT